MKWLYIYGGEFVVCRTTHHSWHYQKPKVKNHIRYEYDLDHIDCEKNEVTFHRYINHSDGSKRKVQYVVGIEEIVQIIPLNKTQRRGVLRIIMAVL
ncbi:hypothetical protein D3H41_07685 [Vibrio neocaledonicus]|nr:hypothetical protein D3H41_07685 [Vibrio neocaledonicus]